jgi:hypothetical protein
LANTVTRRSSASSSDRHVVGDTADQPAERGSDQQPDQRHAALEGGEKRAKPESLAAVESSDAKRCRDGEGVEAQRQDQSRELDH